MDLTPAIVAQVAAWVAMHTGLPVDVPEWDQLTPAEIVTEIPKCRALKQLVEARGGILMFGKCPAFAFYNRDKGVLYIASWLTYDETRSWLAHELKHRGDHLDGRPDPLTSSCEERRAQEEEATAVQNAFNAAHGIGWRYEAPEINCPADTPGQAASS